MLYDEIATLKKAMTRVWNKLKEFVPLIHHVTTSKLNSLNLLYGLMLSSFNIEELYELAFELGIDDNVLPQNVSGKVYLRELIQYIDKLDKTQQLIDSCIEKRPTINWPEQV